MVPFHNRRRSITHAVAYNATLSSISRLLQTRVRAALCQPPRASCPGGPPAITVLASTGSAVVPVPISTPTASSAPVRPINTSKFASSSSTEVYPEPATAWNTLSTQTSTLFITRTELAHPTATEIALAGSGITSFHESISFTASRAFLSQPSPSILTDTVTATASDTPTPKSGATSPNGATKGSKIGAIGGGVISLIVLLALIALGVLIFIRRRKKHLAPSAVYLAAHSEFRRMSSVHEMPHAMYDLSTAANDSPPPFEPGAFPHPLPEKFPRL